MTRGRGAGVWMGVWLTASLATAACSSSNDDGDARDTPATGGGAASAGSAGLAPTAGTAAAPATGGGGGAGADTGGAAGAGAGAGAGTGGAAGAQAGAGAGAGGGGGAVTPLTDAGAVDAGAAATDAGAIDPLSTDRAAFFGDSRCPADLLFCDGFENATLDAAWQKQGGGNADVDTAQVARGQRALHVHTTDNGFAYLRLTSIFPVADNRYWGRMFVRFDALPTAPDWAHWTIAEASGSGDGSVIRVGGQWDRVRDRFGVGTDHGPTGDWTNLDTDPSADAATVPEHEWVCIEWLHDGAADVTRFFWDAVEHPSLATSASDHGGANVPYVMPEFESVWIGWWLYQAGPTPPQYDVWIDEVAFDDERIGCVR